MSRLFRVLATTLVAVGLVGCGEDEADRDHRHPTVIEEGIHGALAVTPAGPVPADGDATYEVALSLRGPGDRVLANTEVELDVRGTGEVLVAGDEKTDAEGKATFRVKTHAVGTFVAVARATIDEVQHEVARTYLTFAALEPARLAFVSIPGSDVGAGSAFEAHVAVLDGNDNHVPGTLEVRIEAEGAEIEGGDPVQVGADGIARFPGLRVGRIGKVTLVAIAEGLPAARSGEITVVRGAPGAIEFLQAPAWGRVGEVLAPVEVRVRDLGGNDVADGTRVRFALMRGHETMASEEAFTLGGAASATHLVPTEWGSNHRIVVTAGMISAESERFLVQDGAPDITRSRIEIRSGTPGPGASLEVEATILGAHGGPWPAAVVAWSATGGGTVEAADPQTNVAGVARATWVLGTTAGEQRLQLHLDAWPEPLELVVFVPAGPVEVLEVVSGDAQIGYLGEELREPLVIRAVDGFGNPASNVPIALVATEGAATFGNERTGADGFARVIVVPQAIGSLLVEASAGSASVQFGATVREFRIAPAMAQPLVAFAGSDGVPLLAQLTRAGTPVEAENVGAQVIAGSAVLSSAEEVTDADGIVRFELDAIASDVEVELSGSDDATSVSVHTVAQLGNIACQVFPGRIQTFGGAEIDHGLDQAYRLLSVEVPGEEPFQLVASFGAFPLEEPGFPSSLVGFSLRFGDPADEGSETLTFTGTTIHHPLASKTYNPGDELVTPRFTLRRLSATVGEIETTVGGAPLVVTFSWMEGGSLVVDSSLTANAGGTTGLCGRNDGSDDVANFHAEPPFAP